MAKAERMEITTEKFRSNLETAIKRDANFIKAHQNEVDLASVAVETMSAMDPSQNGKYLVWLTQRYCDGQFRIEDAKRVRAALEDYVSLQPRLSRFGYDPDLNRYALHDLETMIDAIKRPELGTMDGDVMGFPGAAEFGADIHILYDGPLGTLAVPKTMEAATFLGRGTKWCTAYTDPDENMFDTYVSHFSDLDQLYVFRDANGDKYQFHFETMQFMDARDKPLSPEKLGEFCDLHPVTKLLFDEREADILESDDVGLMTEYADVVLQGRWRAAEKHMIANKLQIDTYIEKFFHDENRFMCGDEYSPERWPEAEKFMLDELKRLSHEHALAGSGKYDYPVDEARNLIVRYARTCIQGQWKELEDELAGVDTMGAAISLAQIYGPCLNPDIAHEREDALEAIKTKVISNPKAAAALASEVMNREWPEAEEVIKRDPEAAAHYAKTVMKRSWLDKEVEDRIATVPHAAISYACCLRRVRTPQGGRWEAAEAGFAQSSDYALTYATDVLGGRFPAGEDAIAKGPLLNIMLYRRNAIKGPWPEVEHRLLENIDVAISYAVETKSRFLLFEEKIRNGGYDKPANGADDNGKKVTAYTIKKYRSALEDVGIHVPDSAFSAEPISAAKAALKDACSNIASAFNVDKKSEIIRSFS